MDWLLILMGICVIAGGVTGAIGFYGLTEL
jgi:hypothetical protein